MALIRSEHANDQAVEIAKEAVTSAEQALEGARARLERRERDQYHEEQIWSDTIRRNSSWVTFGLMGVNIAILLVNLAILEPWRRKRIVKEIREALDEKTIASQAVEGDVEIVQDRPVVIDKLTEESPIVIEEEELEPSVEAVLEIPQSLSMSTATAYIQQLFSEQAISLRQVDFTTAILEAAAIGGVVTATVFVALRPR
jgi:sensitive to high expression protein 9, mitochondrial